MQANGSLQTLVSKLREKGKKPRQAKTKNKEKEKVQDFSARAKTGTTEGSQGWQNDTVLETLSGSPRQ